jgi:uncharacterized protein YuzE
MIPPISVSVDTAADVLYVKREHARIVDSAFAPNDSDFVVNYDDVHNVVGVQLIAAAELEPRLWFEHPDRLLIPSDILDAIDAWFKARF